MKKVLIITIAFVSTLGVYNANAWAHQAHGTTAYIAEQHLTPEAKKKAHYYLKHTLPYYASWMDAWKFSTKFRRVNSWHTGMAMEDGVNYNMKSSKFPGRVMGHLVKALAELGDGKYKNLPDSVVRQRLINMIHYLPDFHCPVHVGFPKNEFAHYRYNIYRKGKKEKYHGFWDGSPGFMRKNWTFERYAAEVDKVTPKQAKKWVKGNIDAWGRDIIKQAHRCYKITPADTDISKLTDEQKAKVNYR